MAMSAKPEAVNGNGGGEMPPVRRADGAGL